MSTWLGIDIGTTAVKVAAVRTGYRKAELVGLASVEVAQAGDVPAAISAAVRAAVGERGGVGDGIAIGLEGQRATVKTLGLPGSAAKQIGEVLPFELESALPFDVEEAVFDYRLLSGVREKKGEELAVLVGVAKTADVVARIEKRVAGAKAYMTFDIDALDPAFAPGTGTPVAGGLTSREALAILRELGRIDFVGGDVVEVAPPYDHADLTAIAGAAVAQTWLGLEAEKRRR